MRRFTLWLLLGLLAASPAWAGVRTITATGEYRMGDNDTRTDAKRLALLDAKRLALEQAGTYLESVTEVKNLQITHDELRAYTAGIVEVLEQTTTNVMEGQQQVVRVTVTAKIDTAVIARQVGILRMNVKAKNELLRARDEAERLRRELEAKTRELATIKSKAEVEAVTKQRQQLISRARANELIDMALTIHAFVFLKYLEKEGSEIKKTEEEQARFRLAALKTLARARDLTEQALALDPARADAHKLLISVLMEEGRYLREEKDHEAARAKFRAAISLNPQDPDNHYQAAGEFLMNGDHDEALIEIRAAIALDPKISAYYTRLGQVLLAKGNIEDAGAEFRKAIVLDATDGFAHIGLGSVLKKMGRKVEAEKEFEEGMRLTNTRIEKLRDAETAQ